MKSTTITPNLIALTGFGLMNAYLVREADGFTLIDTAMFAADKIIAAAADAGAPIRRIAITHGHSDHVGSLDALREKLGAGVPVLIPEIDARVLAGETVDFGPEGRKRGGWPKLRTRPDGRLNPGDVIESLEAVAAPGHTPGQLAFRDRRDNTLIAGDAFSNVGGLAVPNHPHPRFPLPYLATGNRKVALSTAEALADLDPEVLALGHGAVLRAPGTAMAAALSTARAKA